MITILLIVFQLIASIDVIAQASQFYVNFCDSPKSLWCPPSLESFFLFSGAGCSGASNDFIPNFYVNYPMQSFIAFINQSYQIQQKGKEINLTVVLRDIPKKLQIRYLKDMNESIPFFQSYYQEWTIRNNLSSDLPAFSFSSELLINWYLFGLFIYPTLSNKVISTNYFDNVGEGINAKCLRVQNIRSNWYSLPKNYSTQLVLKRLHLPIRKIKLLRDKNVVELEDLLEIQLGSILSEFPQYFLATHTVVLNDTFLEGERVCGFLMNYAQYGTLQNWFRSVPSARNFNFGLVKNLHNLVQAIHKLHQLKYLHCDIKADNILVVPNEKYSSSFPSSLSLSSGNSPFRFVLSDFGNSCKIGKGICYPDRSCCEKGIIFPIELFRSEYQTKIGQQTDWYEFGWLLYWTGCELFRFDFYDFFQLFGLLIQGLTKYSPNSGRFGYRLVEKYFSLVTSLSFIPPFSMVKTLHVLTNTPRKYYAIIQEKNNRKSRTSKLNFHLLGSLMGYHLYGIFILTQQLQLLSTQYWGCCESGEGDELIASSEFVAKKSFIWEFVRDFPLPFIGNFNFLSQQKYYKGGLLVIEANMLHQICFCDQLCFQNPTLGYGCRNNFSANEFGQIISQFDGISYAILKNEHELMHK